MYEDPEYENLGFGDLEFEFLNGSCAALASKLNQLYKYELFHVFLFNKEFDEDVDIENFIVHTLVKTNENEYLDITGRHSASEIISEWYSNRCTTRQMTEIFLIDDKLKIKILKDKDLPITEADKIHYKLEKALKKVNYEYDDIFDLDIVCSNLMKL